MEVKSVAGRGAHAAEISTGLTGLSRKVDSGSEESLIKSGPVSAHQEPPMTDVRKHVGCSGKELQLSHS